ncbi:MAG: ATP-dependent Clp protease adaptor ClpS [Verrucomicrobiota bacterium]
MPTDLPQIEEEASIDLESMWQVVLLDDDDHTYDYVIEMLMTIFGHPVELAYKMACEVDARKRVVVDIDTKEAAELKAKEITDFGPDWRLDRSVGSMSATIEPVE